MLAKEFETRMQELLPSADPEATRSYISYIQELDRDGTHPAVNYFDSVYVEFSLVKGQVGEDIACQLFNAGRSFTWNFFEIRGAANLLKEGVAMDEIFEKARDGLGDPTQEETQEYKDALNALYKARDGQIEALPEQAAPNTLLGLMRSGVSFYNVILRSASADDPGFDYPTMYKCINNKIHELGQDKLKYDLSEWSDVLTAPVVKLSPGRHEMTVSMRGIDERRLADFAETITGYEAQEEAQRRAMEPPRPLSTHIPY